MVNRLRLHYETDHAGSAGEADNTDEYGKICAPVTVAEGIDDRDRNLHAARYLGFPIDWRIAYKSCPVQKEPVCARMDLLHVGVPI